MESLERQEDSREFLYFAGGLALMVLGSGLIAANPTVKHWPAAWNRRCLICRAGSPV